MLRGRIHLVTDPSPIATLHKSIMCTITNLTKRYFMVRNNKTHQSFFSNPHHDDVNLEKCNPDTFLSVCLEYTQTSIEVKNIRTLLLSIMY